MPRIQSALLLLPVLAVLTGPLLAQQGSPAVYQKDVLFALEQLEKQCGHFFPQKKIQWSTVKKEFLQALRTVKTDQDYLVLLVRLLARLKDGHASVRPLEKGKGIQWPLTPKAPQTGPGMFWCRSGKKILVKASWSAAAESGLQPGMEIVKVDGLPAMKWLERKVEERRDTMGFSTDAGAFYGACHWGLGGDQGSRMALEIRTVAGKRGKVAVLRKKASTVPVGPAFPPSSLVRTGRQSYGKTKSGFGYIHLRNVPGELPEQMDTMLAAIGRVPGLILDCRANGGGGCDHDAVLGRFVPTGKSLKRAKAYPIPSSGPNPFGGPLVVIVDAGARSAGETISGMFKEDGRAYMIGETHTAGTSSQKTTIELPSELFSLYVSIRSNKGRFNGGRGIEGVGIIPHEIVEYDARDLARKVDTLIQRAEKLLARFPQKDVPYRPEDYGWKP